MTGSGADGVEDSSAVAGGPPWDRAERPVGPGAGLGSGGAAFGFGRQVGPGPEPEPAVPPVPGGPAWSVQGASGEQVPVGAHGSGFAPPGYSGPTQAHFGHGLVTAPPVRRGRRGPTVAALLVAGLVAAAAGAVAVRGPLTGLLGGGAQPEQVLPAGTAAMARIDLNPSAGQKIDAFRFARAFPAGAGLRADGDPREWLWERATRSLDGAPAFAQAGRWLGSRAAVATVPDPADPARALPVVVLAVTDAGQAEADLRRLRGAGTATADGWLYLAATDAAAASVATAAQKSSLADDPTFVADLDRLGEDGVATIWFEGERLARFAAGLTGPAERLAALGRTVSGHGAFGVRFSGTTLEVAGQLVGSIAVSGQPRTGTEVGTLPATSVGVVAASGVGDLVTRYWSDLAGGVAQATGRSAAEVETLTALLGLDLLADLDTVLGARTALTVAADRSGGPAVGLRVTTDPDAAAPLVEQAGALLGAAGLPLVTRRTGEGYVAATDESLAADLAAYGRLGAKPAFRSAVPDADGAALVAYADVPRALEVFGDRFSTTDRADLGPLAAVGLSITLQPGSATVRLRATTR